VVLFPWLAFGHMIPFTELLAWRRADFSLLVHWNADRIIYEFGITR
jgi:hypothetical protein